MFNRNLGYQPFSNFYKTAAKTGINWGNLLNNTQKTLSIVNQAIPIFYQVKPIWNNAKTMFRVMGEMGKMNNNQSTEETNNVVNDTIVTDTPKTNVNEPNFFI